MTPEDVVRRYPCLYHMAELGSWPSIQRHGLLSTTALLDLGYESCEFTREQIESQQRRKSVRVEHPEYGAAVIRDQKPLKKRKLAGLLEDEMEPREWYELINRKTFFWPDEDGLCTLLDAKAYKERRHEVIVVPTEELLSRHEDRVTLSAINSGSVIRSKVTRGRNTFQSIESYSGPCIVELAVEYEVRDIAELAIQVEVRQAKGPTEVIWRRGGGT